MLLAHAGHWLVWILYAIPVFAVLAAVIVASVRARRLEQQGGAIRSEEEPG